MARAHFAKISATGSFDRRAAALLCGAAWLFLTMPAFPQDLGLRGLVDENALADPGPLKKKMRKSGPAANVPLPEYRPENGNGLAEEVIGGDSAANSSISVEEDAAIAADQTGSDAAPAVAGNTEPDAPQAGSGLDSDIPVPPATGSVEDDGDLEPLRAERENPRESAVEGRRRAEEEDPYAAPGIRAGAFIFRPTLETGLRWTSNSDGSANGAAALLSESNLRLRAESDWALHRLGLEATGAWRRSLSGAETNDPEAGLAADFQFDLSDRTAITGGLGWNHSKEAASAPAAVTGALSRPDLNALTGSLGISRDLGKLALRARANIARSAYGDATDSTGAAVSQEDRNNNYAGLTMRAGYHVSPALTPFLEGEIGRRVFDNETDSFGLERAATRLAIRAGAEVDFGDKLRGDIALGYLVENIGDTALPDVRGLSVAGNLNWSPMRGTNLALTASTTVEGSSTASSAGSLLHALNLAATHRVRANLDLSANLGASLRDYSGPAANEVTLSAGAGFTYWFNRHIGLNSRVAHETVLADDPTRESRTNSVFVGMTFRR